MSRSGVIKWIREGKIKAVEIDGRWRIPYSEIERLLSSGGRVKHLPSSANSFSAFLIFSSLARLVRTLYISLVSIGLSLRRSIISFFNSS
jgi:hypothetical protein